MTMENISDEEAMSWIYENYLDAFKKTGNPIDAWLGINFAMIAKLPIPEEFLNYLHSVAREITKIAFSATQKAPKGLQNDVVKALQMSKDGAGRGSPFSERAMESRSKIMASYAYLAIEQFGYEDAAFADVGETFNVSKATVRRAYKKHLERWGAKAREMFESGIDELRREKMELSSIQSNGGLLIDLVFNERYIIVTEAERLFKNSINF